jgi:hypothetical protein
MTTAYTSLLGLALPVTGELSGTWGDTVNTAITSLLDTAIAGTTSITTDADITLSTTTGASNQARQAIILWNPASGTTTRNITAPAQSKMYVVINASGGTQSIVIRGAGPTTGVTIAKGESATVAWNGSDFVKVSSSGGAITFTDLTVTGNTILGDAAADTLTVNATSTFASPVNFQGLVKLPSTGRSAAAALTVTAPAFLYGVASTYTDTTSSGTIAAMAPFYSIAQPTLSTSNVTTYTNAATLYLANAPAAGGSATITNPYALYVAAGTAYFAGQAQFANGALATPSVSNINDINTGIYFPAADTLGFVEGGVEALRINADGQTSTSIAGTASLPSFTRTGDENTGIYFPAADTIAFTEGGVEALRINSSGNVGIGNEISQTDSNFTVNKNVTGSVAAYGIRSLGTIQADVTTSTTSFQSQLSTVASAFTLTTLRHYQAAQGTIGAGSTVTNQYGFSAESSLTGATNNYGFYSDIAAGTNRWNFFANGSAQNYFAGSVGIGISVPVAQLTVYGAGQTTASMSTSTSLGSTIYLRDNGAAAGNGGAVMFGANQGAFAAIKGLLTDGANNTTGAVVVSIRPVTTDSTLTEAVRITGTGNVGIGIAGPLFKLQVGGAVARKYVTPGTTGSPAEEQGFVYADDSSTPVAGMWFFNSFSSGNPTQLALKTRNSAGTVTEAVRIDASQNVGIGTAGAPLSRLDVALEATLTRRFLVNYDDSLVTIKSANSSANPETFRLVADNIRFNTGTSGSGTERARILVGGNFGIGTETPNTKLELRTDTLTAGNEPNITLFNRGTSTTSTTSYYIGGTYGAAFRDVRNPGYVAGVEFYRDSASAGLNSQGSIRFYAASDAGTLAELRASWERMRLESSGNLLVGTNVSTGAAGNTAQVVGGIHNTASASALSFTNGTATTIFTISNYQGSQSWIVCADVAGQSNQAYACVYIVTVNYSGSAAATQLVKGALASISVSGLNVQYTQSSGGTQNSVQWSAVRIM